MKRPVLIPCERCQSEGRILTNDGGPDDTDHGECPDCEGTCGSMLQFFEYGHLPPHLQEISIRFGVLASELLHLLPRNPERTAALRKLLEAKDCAVRAKLYK